jgi:hypothetical protein
MNDGEGLPEKTGAGSQPSSHKERPRRIDEDRGRINESLLRFVIPDKSPSVAMANSSQIPPPPAEAESYKGSTLASA